MKKLLLLLLTSWRDGLRGSLAPARVIVFDLQVHDGADPGKIVSKRKTINKFAKRVAELGEKRILSQMTNTAPTTEPAPMLANNRP
jgi:hypothetical protein